MQSRMQELEYLLDDPQLPLFNVGAGADHSIRALAEITSYIVGYDGEIHWDRQMPDDVSSKLLDVSRLKKLVWQPQTFLKEGIQDTYRRYMEQLK